MRRPVIGGVTREMERTRYQILRALKMRPLSFWELIRSQDSSLAEMTQALRHMLTENRIVFDQKTRRFSLGTPLDPLPQGNGLCPTCQGKGFILEGRFEETLGRFLEITTDRPQPIFDYNQGIIHPRDLALKSAFMHERGDVEGRSILLIGDDDLFSIFLALLGLSCTVMVLEVDERFIQYIDQKANRHRLTITTKQYDVHSPLPPELQETFDAFITEPPEGLKGMLLFLQRAADALDIGGGGYFGLTTLESSLPKWLAIQRFLMGKGMVITDLLRNFSLYPESGDPIDDYGAFPMAREFPVDPGTPDVDYFRSSLIRVEKTTPTTGRETNRFYADEDTWVTVNPEENK